MKRIFFFLVYCLIISYLSVCVLETIVAYNLQCSTFLLPFSNMQFSEHLKNNWFTGLVKLHFYLEAIYFSSYLMVVAFLVRFIVKKSSKRNIKKLFETVKCVLLRIGKNTGTMIAGILGTLFFSNFCLSVLLPFVSVKAVSIITIVLSVFVFLVALYFRKKIYID